MFSNVGSPDHETNIPKEIRVLVRTSYSHNAVSWFASVVCPDVVLTLTEAVWYLVAGVATTSRW